MALLKKNGRFVCGGSLISNRKVLTAKHCVEPRTSRDKYQVVLGEHRRDVTENTEQTINVLSICLNLNVDAAVLLLSRPAIINAAVTPIQLATQVPPIGLPMTVSGWGATMQSSFVASNILMFITQSLASNTACNAEGLNIKPGEICVGDSVDSYSNVCYGDSGSPLVFPPFPASEPNLIGIVSRGHRDCPKLYHYAVFVSVPRIRHWVNSNCNVKQGYWSPWFAWASCTATCGSTGIQTRRRQCLFGKACSGSVTDLRQCRDPTPPPCEQPGDWGPWTSWSPCSRSCNGLSYRFRRCLKNSCPGRPFTVKPCNPECPGWMPWSDWSLCSGTCDGTRIRTRRCKAPHCPGSSSQRSHCSPPCGWMPWSNWSLCSRTCDGTRIRTRRCDAPHCPGSSLQRSHCSPPCGWMPWSNWSPCSRTCDGTRIRTRRCKAPHCPGSSLQRSPCSPCGRWTRWYDRDNPSGNGDYEAISLELPKPCGGSTPLDYEYSLVRPGGCPHVLCSLPPNQVLVHSVDYGFRCVNRDQKKLQIIGPGGITTVQCRCCDYKIKYLCH